jgi:hypothetical protein
VLAPSEPNLELFELKKGFLRHPGVLYGKDNQLPRSGRSDVSFMLYAGYKLQHSTNDYSYICLT